MTICPYFHEPAELAYGTEVYPHRPDLQAKQFWLCGPCDAYVGCHKNSDTPLGRLANAELRASQDAGASRVRPAVARGQDET